MGLLRTAWITAGTAFASLTLAGSALAAPMDIAPERLVQQPGGLTGSLAGQTCQSIAANPELAVKAGSLPNNFPCSPDNASYRNLMSELGFALAPTAFHPARTTGFGGFAVTFEASYTKINTSAIANGASTPYWQLGTEGPKDPSSGNFSTKNSSPDSLLQVYSLKARKGIGLGFEITGALGYLANTSLWLTGADIRWSLLEGFRVPNGAGYLPDVSVGGGVRTVGGSSKFFLTTVGIDAQISKPFTLADSAVLTPYIGYQRLFVFADSTVVDATPNVNALAQCGYQGNNPTTGAPVCGNKLSNGADNNGDFNNNITFDKVRTQRNRGIAGINYRYDILYLAGQFLMDLTDPNSEGNNLVGDRQWTISLEAGVFF